MALTGNDAMSNACKSSGSPVDTQPHALHSRNPRDEPDKGGRRSHVELLHHWLTALIVVSPFQQKS